MGVPVKDVDVTVRALSLHGVHVAPDRDTYIPPTPLHLFSPDPRERFACEPFATEFGHVFDDRPPANLYEADVALALVHRRPPLPLTLLHP